MAITPGPWQTRFIYRMIKAARATAGLSMHPYLCNDWDDACLMAAAPDMLAELKDILSFCREEGCALGEAELKSIEEVIGKATTDE